MQLEIEGNVLEIFPHITIAAVSGSLKNARPELESCIGQLRSEALAQIGTSGLNTENLLNHPHISAWRDAYQRFGVKAKTHKPTHEALVRRLLKEGIFPDINPVVNVYLANQAAHLLPHGGYDSNTLSGTVRLAISPGGERFEPLGGGEELTNPNEVIYRDDKRILTRRWNYRDCDATKITSDTNNFILMIESPSINIQDEAVEKAARDLVAKYDACFEGTFQYVLFKATPGTGRMGGKSFSL